MIPGINKRQAAQMMRRMGIQQEEIDATEVIIKTPEKELIISNPQVAKVNLMGQETFQIIGQVTERNLSSEPDINEEDIKTVMEQAGVTTETAKDAIINAHGDLAQAILSLKKE
jgi:nascent polypeptide-associated complex subunit alpha